MSSKTRYLYTKKAHNIVVIMRRYTNSCNTAIHTIYYNKEAEKNNSLKQKNRKKIKKSIAMRPPNNRNKTTARQAENISQR